MQQKTIPLEKYAFLSGESNRNSSLATITCSERLLHAVVESWFLVVLRRADKVSIFFKVLKSPIYEA